MNERPRLWTRNYIIIFVANLLTFISFYFLMPTLPLYARDVLHVDRALIGYVTGAFTVSAVTMRLFAGSLLARFYRKNVYLAAMALFSLAMFCYVLATSFQSLILLRIFHGISWGIVSTSAATIVADIVPRERLGEGIGLYGISNTIAMAVGPLVGLRITSGSQGYFTLFHTAFFITLVILMMIVMLNPEKQIPEKRTGLSVDSFIERKVVGLTLVNLFLASVYGGVLTFVTIYARQLQIAEGDVFFLVYALALFVVRIAAGRIYDRQGPKHLMAAGFLFYLAGFVILAQTKNLFALLSAAIFLGLGYGILNPTLQTMAVARVVPARRGLASATYLISMDLGIGIGSVVIGYIYKHLGLSTAYAMSTVFVLLAAGIFFFRELRFEGKEGSMV